MAKVSFEEGDVVQLKSGGPKMTISNRPEALPNGITKDDVLCVWFTPTQEFKSMWYRNTMLTPASP